MDTRNRTRPLTWEDFRGIWDRRKWLFLLTAAGVAAGTCVVAALIPSLYRSEALILCESQQVSQNYVKPLSDTDIEQQLSTLVQETQSRSRLERLIQEYEAPELNLKSNQRISDDVVDDFRGRIEIQIIKDNDPRRKANPYALRVAFEDPRPTVARQVANELSSFLVSEKQKNQEATAEDTRKFLASKLELAANDLKEKERALADYKQRYAGQLPADEQLTMQILSRLQSEIQANQEGLERARQQQANGDANEGSKASSQASASKEAAASKLDGHLQTLQATLADYQSRYKPDHPDVVRTKEEIERLEAQMAKDKAVASEPGSSKTPATGKPNPNSATKNKDASAEIVVRTAEQKRLQDQVEAYQKNLRAIPSHQEESFQLQRSFDLSKNEYDTLKGKLAESQLATEVDTSLQGERLRIQDFASLPNVPYWPQRWKINLGGIAAALFVGLALAGALELGDSSVKCERDAEFYFGMRNLAVVPELLTASEIGRSRRKKLIGVAAAASVAVVLGGVLYYLYFVWV